MRHGIHLINFGLTNRIQMGIYAALAIGQALGGFLNGLTLASIVYSASRRLHDVCLSGSLVFPYLTARRTPSPA